MWIRISREVPIVHLRRSDFPSADLYAAVHYIVDVFQQYHIDITNAFNKVSPRDATATEFNDVTSDINVQDKYEGRQAWSTTASRPVWATGAAASAVWVDGSGATVYTPV